MRMRSRSDRTAQRWLTIAFAAVTAIGQPAAIQNSTFLWAAARDMTWAAGDDFSLFLLTDGRALGVDGRHVQLFNPTTGTWSAGASPPLAATHVVAAMLLDGRILLTSGVTADSPPIHLRTTRIYDPASNSWTSAADMNYYRNGHTLTVLQNGMVLAAGGSGSDGYLLTDYTGAEIFDPATGLWRPTGSLNDPPNNGAKMVRARVGAAAALLPDGRVLIAGGTASTLTPDPYDSEIFNGSSWSAGGAMAVKRRDLTLTALPDGRVLAAGGGAGILGTPGVATSEIYFGGAWSLSAPMNHARAQHTASLTRDGQVLVAAGYATGRTEIVDTELFDPPSGTWTVQGTLNKPRRDHAAVRLTDGRILVAGGMAHEFGFSSGGGGITVALQAAELAFAPGTAPKMAVDRTQLFFGAVSTGSAFTAQTRAQTVRLSQSGSGTVTWTAASSVPWLTVSPASGTGPAALSIAVQSVLGLFPGAESGAITLTGAANAVGPINVTLNVFRGSVAPSPPFGSFDTPAGDSTVLAGSVAVTGWTLDDVGVQKVELWRDLQPGETTPPYAGAANDPRNGKVFISIVTFIDGARPDVESVNATTPFNYRGGWGYLMLTWGLFGQGNGTYKLYAVAFDEEGHVATIGSKSIIVSNNSATKPFGSVDTPAIGGDASGPNFGWGLTPKVNGAATCKIQASGVQYSIDSGPLQPVVYGDARTDIAGAFPGFSNTAAAGGHAIIDWTALTNGSHTIGWLITDDCSRADGVGSRFFNVTTGANLIVGDTTSAIAAPLSASLAVGGARPERESRQPVMVARGYGELPQRLEADADGMRRMEARLGERLELRVAREFADAYQLGPGDDRRARPIGSTWDKASGTFWWQPAPGFLGPFRIVFSNGRERITVRVVVIP